jgi:hypothetical protein
VKFRRVQLQADLMRIALGAIDRGDDLVQRGTLGLGVLGAGDEHADDTHAGAAVRDPTAEQLGQSVARECPVVH